MSIESMIEAVIKREGGYVNHPNDPGGETNYGITKAVARANGYGGDMRTMPRDVAAGIYRSNYFIRPGFEAVALLSEPVAEELFDTAVNMGVKIAARFLQRSLNFFNKRGRLYPDIVLDGDVGPGTIHALENYFRLYGGSSSRLKDAERRLLKALNSLQGARYIELGEANEKLEDFGAGWFDWRVA